MASTRQARRDAGAKDGRACTRALSGARRSSTDERMESSPHPGVLLEDLTWIDAEARLGPEALVVIPIGAAAKEHGPHLRLKNDLILADYFKRRVLSVFFIVTATT